MIKYGLKEFARNIYSNIFIAVQLAIAFIIMTAAVSSVLSRIEMYTPVKKYFPDGKGLYICNIYDTAPLDSELKNIDDKSLLEFIKPSISKDEIVSLFDEAIYLDKVNDKDNHKYNDRYTLSTQKKKEKENKNKKENKNIGEKSNGSDIKTTREFKHTVLYEKEDEYIYKKPSEEQLRYAREL